MPETSDFECPYIPKEQIWQKAEDFRADFWPEDTLPVDMEKIVQHMNTNAFQKDYKYAGRFKIGHKQVCNAVIPSLV